MARQMQLRLVYSLFKPAIRCAARFGIPVRTLVELVRLSLCEALVQQGSSTAEIAKRLGLTPRHVRSFRSRLQGDFFDAEKEVGLSRQVEDAVADKPLSAKALAQKLPGADRETLDATIAELIAEGRLDRDGSGALSIGKKYVVLTSDTFHQRIDALNHFFNAAYRATLERLVFDNRQTAMLKTVSFNATPDQVHEFMRRLEGHIRTEIAELEERASFDARGARFDMALAFTPQSVAEGEVDPTTRK